MTRLIISLASRAKIFF